MTDNQSNSKSDLLNEIELDDEAKSIFLRMSREDQLAAILGMLQYVRREVAIVKRNDILMKGDLDQYKQQQEDYRLLREREEKHLSSMIRSIMTDAGIDEQSTRPLNDAELLTTTQKIVKEVGKAFAARFDFWIYMRDRVLPQIITFIVLALLALVFAKQLP